MKIVAKTNPCVTYKELFGDETNPYVWNNFPTEAYCDV